MSSESGTTSISDLPSANQKENIQLNINENNIDMNNIFKEVQNVGTKGNLNLPSRDIPIDPTHISMDKESSTPNYIPTHEDYINDIYEPHNEMIENQRKKENRDDSLEILYNELQIPILLGLLFFIFQIPNFNNLLNKYFVFLFKNDGNLTFQGYIFKSILFAISFYAIDKVMNIVNN